MAPGFVGCDLDCDATVSTWNVWSREGLSTATSSCTTASTNENIWIPWNKVCTPTAVTTGHAEEVWYEWQNSTVPVTTASFDGTWHRWTVRIGKPFNGVVQATPAELAQWERQAEAAKAREAERHRQYEAEAPERERQARERERKFTAAQQRAERLLLELLDEEQTKQYRKEKQFHVVAANGERYLVDATGTHGNIRRLNAEGKAVEKLCVPLGDCECPKLDHIVAQLLALRHNIDHLLAKANRTQLLDNNTERILPRRA